MVTVSSLAVVSMLVIWLHIEIVTCMLEVRTSLKGQTSDTLNTILIGHAANAFYVVYLSPMFITLCGVGGWWEALSLTALGLPAWSYQLHMYCSLEGSTAYTCTRYIPTWKRSLQPVKSTTKIQHCIYPSRSSNSKLITPSFASSEDLVAVLQVRSSEEHPLILCPKHYHELYHHFHTPMC